MIPATAYLRPESIPVELRAIPQWIVWNEEPRADGKPAKVPVDPVGGFRINAHDPANWLTFEEACQLQARYGRSGVAFDLSESDPYVCVDLDDAYDPASSELTPTAEAVVRLLDSCVEVSPSGRGLHVWVRGELPAGHGCVKWINGQKVEVYSRAHYIATTGNCLHIGHAEPPATIAERQAELGMLALMMTRAGTPEKVAPTDGGTDRPPTMAQDERDILERAMRSPRFDAAYRGDLSGYRDDHSAADQAVCNRLAACGATPDQIDTLFRKSALFRDKWDKVHHADGRTYGQGTIDKAFDRPALVMAPQPSGIERPRGGGSCAAQLAAKDAEIRQLRAENAELHATIDTLRMRVKQADEQLKIWNNHELGPMRATAVAVVTHLRTEPATKPDAELSHQVYLAELARLSGQSTDTVSKHLSKLATLEVDERPVLAKKVVTVQECVNVDTGEIVPMHREMWLGTASVDDLAATLAVLAPDTPKWGGKRTPCPRCGSERRITACGDCGLVFADTALKPHDAELVPEPPHPKPHDAGFASESLKPHLADCSLPFPQERGEPLKPHLAGLGDTGRWTH